jgi:hypothetical protein
VKRATHQYSPNQLKALRALCAAPYGLHASDWERASGLAHSTFYNIVPKLEEMGLVEAWPDDKYRASDDGRALCPPEEGDKHSEQSNHKVDQSNGLVDYTEPLPVQSN